MVDFDCIKTCCIGGILQECGLSWPDLWEFLFHYFVRHYSAKKKDELSGSHLMYCLKTTQEFFGNGLINCVNLVL